MGNAANTNRYKQRWEKIQPLFIADNFKKNSHYKLTEKYTVCTYEYIGKIEKYNCRGCDGILLDNNSKLAAWQSIDNQSDFYKIIEHNNGKEYMVFRQDLYGYSVLDISTGELMQFFPEASLEGMETFIWTDINYNSISNVLAVSGCCWGCPFNILILTFNDPMSENQTYSDLAECIGGDGEALDDVDFIKWKNNDLYITRYTGEEVIITQSEYLHYLAEKGKDL